MKRFIVSAIALLCVAIAASAQKDTLRVLAIGNSFSEDAIEQNLAEIAQADGKVIIVGNLYIGGCPLQTHWVNASGNKPAYRYRYIGTDLKMTQTDKCTIENALKAEPWDVVSLQQRSGFSGIHSTYEPFLGNLLAYLKERCKPGVTLVWHQTWAYQGDSGHTEFPFYNQDQMTMYKAIMKTSRKAVKDHNLTVVPCGTAVQNLRTSFIGDHVTRDGFHMDKVLGRYLLAATWYTTLTGRPVVGNTYCPKGLEPEKLLAAQKAAEAAAAKPYKVTNQSK